MNRLEDWGLIVVDLQNDFLATGGYYARRDDLDKQVSQGELSVELRDRIMTESPEAPPAKFSCRTPSLAPVITNILSLIRHASARNRPVAYLQAVYSRDFDVQPPFFIREPLRKHHPCKPHSWGAAMIDPISLLADLKLPRSTEKVIEKHTYDGFFQTELMHWLKAEEVRTVVIAGVETHVCVFATAKSASIHQFETIILEDCVWTARDELGIGALAIFREAYGSTAKLQEILDAKPNA